MEAIEALYYPGASVAWSQTQGVLDEAPAFPGREAQIAAQELGEEWARIRKVRFASQEAFERGMEEALRAGGKLERNALAKPQAHPEQWALSNQGQPQEIEISDIQVLRVRSLPGEDIGLTSLPPEDPSRKIIVAVVDSGLDVEHPAFARTLHKTPSECEALAQYRQCMNTERDKEVCHQRFARMDTDGNGYPLDCNGWSVTGAVDRRTGIAGRNDPSDEDGHGTHVSGIIAAQGFVSGAIQSVELLPVKVMGREVLPATSEELPRPSDPDFTQVAGFADVVARGILYAVRSGAQVINLSLGYSITDDSSLMRRMVELAQSRGIVVVAAAGNQSSRTPVYPCTYPGVICVASHSADGSLSYFSNFGDGTDIAAPGHSILSTWIRRVYPSRFTERRGFDFKNGTSQASPYVAAAVARLLNLGLSPREAVARLLANGRPHRPPTAMPDPVEKRTQGGNLDLGRSWQASRRAWIAPTQKGPLYLKWDATVAGAPTQGTVRVTLKNLWAEARGPIRVTLGTPVPRDGKTSALRLGQSEFAFVNWAEDEEKEIEFAASWPADFDLSGEYVLPIRVETSNGVQELFKSLEFFVPVQPFDSGMVPGDGITITPIEAQGALPSMTFKPVGTDGSLLSLYTEANILHVTAWAKSDGRYQRLQTLRLGAPTERLVSVTRRDFDRDGQMETAIATVDTGSKKFRIRYMDEHFAELASWRSEFSTDTVVPPRELTWIENQGRWIPHFVAVGKIPTEDEPPYDPWRALLTRTPAERMRLYKILPGDLAQESLRLVIPVARERDLPVAQLIADPETQAVWALSYDGTGYAGVYRLIPFDGAELATQRSVTLNMETYGHLATLPTWKSPGSWPVFWTPSTMGRLRLFTLQPDSDGLSVQPLLFPAVRTGDAARELLSLTQRSDGSVTGYYRSRYFLHSFDSRQSRVEIADTRMHEAGTAHVPALVRGEPALVLAEQKGAPLTTEVLLPGNAGGELSRPARLKTLGVRGCQMTDLVPVEGGPVRKLRYFCGSQFVEIDL